MRAPFPIFSAAILALVVVAGCGTTVRPHVRAGPADPPGMFPGDRMNPRPDSDRGVPDELQPLVDQVCRVNSMRSGWIAIQYVQGDANCPESTDRDNPYTVAVIERYSHKPIGTVMTVCADQTVPRQWIRESNRDVSGTCQGARVREGAPTVMLIRRVAG